MIVLIGAGNLATNIGLAMQKNGLSIGQVYSRTEQSASVLAQKLNTTYTTDLAQVRTDADFYLYALKDDVLTNVAEQINVPNAMHIHTAGSVPVSVFSVNKKNYGVLYPLQTFSKNRKVNFNNIPLFIEANTPQNLQKLRALAEEISTEVYELDSQNREKLHLAAVFACNFTNRMYAIANDLVADAQLPFKILLPLIDETAKKVHSMEPRQAQTGPAVRYDKKIIDKHIAMLEDGYLKMMYELISENIAHQEEK